METRDFMRQANDLYTVIEYLRSPDIDKVPSTMNLREQMVLSLRHSTADLLHKGMNLYNDNPELLDVIEDLQERLNEIKKDYKLFYRGYKKC